MDLCMSMMATIASCSAARHADVGVSSSCTCWRRHRMSLSSVSRLPTSSCCCCVGGDCSTSARADDRRCTAVAWSCSSASRRDSATARVATNRSCSRRDDLCSGGSSSGCSAPRTGSCDPPSRTLTPVPPLHPNLLPLKGYYWTPQLQLLITDYAPHGSLEARLHGGGGRAPLTWEERFRVVSGIARGLAHLHQAFRPPLIHYSVKPSNILVDERCNPMVGDFGLAQLLANRAEQRHVVSSGRFQGGGAGYVAPELACQSLRVNEKCDIYGF